ncbi:MAG: hypothetical protein ABSA13_15320 [Beijerinckiaceae bacterium]|jgi:hypothetical protein
MTEATEMLSPAEAAFVAGVALSDVNRVIDRKILPEGFVTKGQGRRVSASACILVSFYFGSAQAADFERAAVRHP